LLQTKRLLQGVMSGFTRRKSLNAEETMKRIVAAVVGIFLVMALTGCGGGDDNPPQFTTEILSDAALDGDIAQNPSSGAFTVAQGNTQSVFAGIHPVSGVEYRAFLNFPLTGANGVPGNAIIVSAFIDIVINSIEPQPLNGTIPLRIDLVSFQPPTLLGTDFSRTLQPALATTTLTPPISQADFGRHIFIDVTPLMAEAQLQGLADLQLRILEDLGVPAPGRIEINDTTGANRATLAPLLVVTYF